MEIDLRKPLPFPDNSCSHIVMSHCLEHVDHRRAWSCLQECYRSLAPGGVLRVAIPDIARMWTKVTPEYCEAVKKGGHGDGTKKSAIHAAIHCHGHEGAWTEELLATIMEAIGFNVRPCRYGQSPDPVLCNVDMHGKTVGDAIAQMETSIIEGVK